MQDLKDHVPLPDPADQPTLTVEQAAKYLSISRASAYSAARRGEIPTIRLGRRLVVSTALLRQLVGIDEPVNSSTN